MRKVRGTASCTRLGARALRKATTPSQTLQLMGAILLDRRSLSEVGDGSTSRRCQPSLARELQREAKFIDALRKEGEAVSQLMR